MMLTPGALCLYTVTAGDNSYVVLARYMGIKPQSGDKKLMVMYPVGDGKGHVQVVIRNSVLRNKVMDLQTFFRERERERLRSKCSR